jgi:cell division protein FtsN
MADYSVERGQVRSEGRGAIGVIAGLVAVVCLVALAYLWTQQTNTEQPLPVQPAATQAAPPVQTVKPIARDPAPDAVERPVSNAVGATGDTRPARAVLVAPVPADA